MTIHTYEIIARFSPDPPDYMTHDLIRDGEKVLTGVSYQDAILVFRGHAALDWFIDERSCLLPVHHIIEDQRGGAE